MGLGVGGVGGELVILDGWTCASWRWVGGVVGEWVF